MKQLMLISVCIAASLWTSAQEQCVKSVVNLKGDQVTLTTSGEKNATLQQNFVYYERKRQRKNDESYSIPKATASNPSKPLLLSTKRDVTAVPEKYRVSVSTPQKNMTACPDSESNLATTLKVERLATFTGNYPGTKVDPRYEEISKRHYKMAARKIRKIERKEEKIARRTEVNVGVKSSDM